MVINYSSNRSAAEESAAAVETQGGSALIFQADIADEDAAKALVDATVGAWGRLDLLVSNAGIAPKVRADLLEAAPASYDEVMATNLKGPYFLTQFLTPIPITEYLSNLLSTLKAVDIISSMVKALVFGGIMGIVAPLQGFAVKVSSTEVPVVAIKAVGQGFVACVLANALITLVYYI